jgi:phage/plasmid-associated DNA primase
METTLANFVRFTIPKITTYLNADGIEKKKPIGMPSKWTEIINESTYKNYINNSHKAMCLLTGKINDLTIIDFDKKEVYDLALKEYPELKNYKTIQTRRGYHIYCKYDANVKTRSNALVTYDGVDVASDGHMVFAPPTSYIDLEGNENCYIDLGGEILDIPKFIINDLKQNQEQPKNTKVKKIIVVNDAEAITDNESETETPSKLQELLQLISIDKKDRTTWLRICSCIKYNGLSNNDWLNFCKKNCLNIDTEKEELFKNLNPYPIEIHYLQSLAKKSNQNGYKLWLEKYDIYFINADDLDDPYKTAVTISNTLKDTLVLCKENWYMLTDNQLWKQQKEPSFYIINELRKYIDESNKKLVHKISQASGEEKDKLIEKSKIYLKAYKTISGSSFLNVLTKYLKTLLADDKFADKLDANKGLLAFQNGIMDLETKTFREGILSSDFVTQTIPYDYVKGNESKKMFVKSVLLKILNNNAEHLEYFLSIIGYTFIGSPNLEKSIYFCVDKTDKACGDNGKTFFFDILTALLPNYVYKSKGSLLEEGNTKVHKQLVMMKGKRLVWLDEFGKKKSNSELMKEIGDGLNIENEVMFGTSETINIMFKLFTLTNNMPIIDPKDTAVYNRYKQISYGSHFDRTGNRVEEDAENLLFIADTSLGDKIKAEYYNEVFDIIIEYANKYYSKKLPSIPIQFIKDTKETQKSNDAFANWFDENCEIDINERVALKAIVSQSGLSEKLVKEGMIRMGFKYDKDLSKLGKDESNKPYKGGYVGIKLLDIVEEE